MAEKKTTKTAFSLLTAAGIIFALLLCLLISAMVVVAFPGSMPFIELLIKPDGESIALNLPEIQIKQTATPFQPIPAHAVEVVSPANPTPMPPVKSDPTPQAAPTSEIVQPSPTAAPETKPAITELPLTASISGVYGSPQLYTLDCEAQAAVDFARFFGVNINESEFISRLPYSDDPEEGFVGAINGPMGQLPPSDYGVHAKPIARLLREYGVKAKAVRGWDLDKIRNEIASGRPVIAWIVNLPFDIESQDYTASNGNTTRVARFEHTWIITGYNMNVFTVVDSQWTYNVKISTLQERWDALGNQAIVYRGE
jgi:uncharacterized protein YvpB